MKHMGEGAEVVAGEWFGGLGKASSLPADFIQLPLMKYDDNLQLYPWSTLDVAMLLLI